MYGLMYNFKNLEVLAPLFSSDSLVLHDSNTKHRRGIGRAYRKGKTTDWRLQSYKSQNHRRGNI